MAVKSPAGTAMRTLLLFLLTGLIVLLVYGVLTTMIGNRAIRSLQIRVGLYQGLRLFIEHLIPIQATALLLAYSLFFNHQAFFIGKSGFIESDWVAIAGRFVKPVKGLFLILFVANAFLIVSRQHDLGGEVILCCGA